MLKTHRAEIDTLREQLREAVTSRADAEASRKSADVTWQERVTSLKAEHAREVDAMEKRHVGVLEAKMDEARAQWQQVADFV